LVAFGVAVLCDECAGSSAERNHAPAQQSPAPDLRGMNWDGRPFALGNLRGTKVILFFGYTSCPDVCPTALATLRRVAREFRSQGREIAIVFVSLDPERDTLAKLANYIPLFDKSFFGVRMDEKSLRTMTSVFEVRFSRNGSPAPGYTIDHTGALFVVDESGQVRLRLPSSLDADAIRQEVDQLLNQSVSRDAVRAPTT
jgi:protein SCO1/2